MGHSYSSCLMHCVFSTKDRQKFITGELQLRLWPYIGGIAKENEMIPLCVGGVADHIHVLLAIPTTMSVAKAVQLIKGGSSKWIHETFPSLRNFAWQQGYGAFSVSISHMEKAVAYIKGQEKHHLRKTFEQEFVGFLKRHGIPYDERYVFG